MIKKLILDVVAKNIEIFLQKESMHIRKGVNNVQFKVKNMNLINKRVLKDKIIDLPNNELHQDNDTKKYFISDDDFLNVSMLKLDFDVFNSYVKEEEQDDTNVLYEFDKKIVIQFLKDKSNYSKHFILK